MALNFIEQNVTKYFNISNQQYSTITNSNDIKPLKTENLYLWKLFQAISSANVKRSDILWSSKEEEFLIKQWIEYTNSHILHASVSQVTSHVLNELNQVFSKQSFLVADRFTLADVFMYYSLISVFKELTLQSKEKHQHVSRWFSHVQSLPEVRLGNPVVLFSKTPLYSGSSH
ncbi:eukaryotic translation elongation factor 1 epsilon-1-like isoform X2 [Diaphorina citri]|nr:eukaryotic translation elongation factor 1 epsilon-1-like isoform X2 [Diaphorina citri]